MSFTEPVRWICGEWMDPETQARFWSHVDSSGGYDSCWPFTASLSVRGYGRFAINRRPRFAHRISFELIRRPIPEGLTLDHLCRNRACVNPLHLEPVSNRENLLRGTGFPALNARKTHCPKGHEYTADNTIVSRKNQRDCRACTREYARSHPRRRAS